MDSKTIPPAIAQIAPDGQLTPRQKRRLLLRLALKNVKPGAGSSHEFMRSRTAMQEWPDLRDVLFGIDWAIVGGVATRAYMPERMTKDLDILIRAQDETAVLERLQSAGYTVESKLSIGGYLLHSPDGTEIDLLSGDQTWLEEAFAKLNKDPAGYPVLGLPYLILLKLESSRAQDIADIARMLGWADEEQLTAVRDVVARYSPADKEDLESLIYLGQQERQSPDDT